jgi:hypothetical protein
MEEGSRQFLPPQPAGPEPELGGPPAPPPPPPAQQAPEPAYGWQQPPPPQPDNGPAVAGFVLSIVSVSLLVLSAGLSSLISLGCAIPGLVYSRKGKRKVESGETTKNAGIAQAGFIVGIVSVCLSAVASLFWVAVVIAAVNDEEVRDDIEREFDNSESIRAGLQVAAALARLLVT